MTSLQACATKVQRLDLTGIKAYTAETSEPKLTVNSMEAVVKNLQATREALRSANDDKAAIRSIVDGLEKVR